MVARSVESISNVDTDDLCGCQLLLIQLFCHRNAHLPLPETKRIVYNVLL